MERQSFSINQSITWSDWARTKIAKIIERYGDGPFTVKTVAVIPNGICDCGKHPATDPCPDVGKGYGEKTLQESLGHHQWLNIAAPDGQEIRGHFNGSYFQPYVPPKPE